MVKPYHEAVDGKLLLDQIIEKVNLHITCEPQVAVAIALWIMFTWCINAFDIAPIACITAPEKRCGKSQLLTLMSLMSKNPLNTSNISPAGLFRTIDAFAPTLFIDEADTFVAGNNELRGILNSGQDRANAYVIRLVGEKFEPRRFCTFGAKAIAGIGQLPSTLKDRSITLELRRQYKDEVRQRLRHTDKAEFALMSRMLMRWAQDNMEALAIARPVLPDVLNHRAQDNWEPLFAIADQAGGHWPETARQAAITISGIDEESQSINEQLLSDLRDIFQTFPLERWSTKALLQQLCANEETPWHAWNKGKPMTAYQLAHQLKPFKIRPKQIRVGSETCKGYEAEDFKTTFERYLSKCEPPSLTLPETGKHEPNGIALAMLEYFNTIQS